MTSSPARNFLHARFTQNRPVLNCVVETLYWRAYWRTHLLANFEADENWEHKQLTTTIRHLYSTHFLRKNATLAALVGLLIAPVFGNVPLLFFFKRGIFFLLLHNTPPLRWAQFPSVPHRTVGYSICLTDRVSVRFGLGRRLWLFWPFFCLQLFYWAVPLPYFPSVQYGSYPDSYIRCSPSSPSSHPTNKLFTFILPFQL